MKVNHCAYHESVLSRKYFLLKKDQYSPVGLEWYTATAMEQLGKDEKQAVAIKVTSQFVCQICNNETNPCLYDGICRPDGRCECSLGSKGDLCEINPIGNGHCDEFFNTVQNEYDGGDCCESTCQSSEEFICGKDGGGYTDIGYFNCHLPNYEWRPNGEAVVVEDRSRSPASTMALTQNGQVLVVAVRAGNSGRLHIYDKQGPQWTSRDIIEDIGPVTKVAVSAPKRNVYKTPDTDPPIVVAVSKLNGNGLGVYKCTESTFGCAAITIGHNFTGRVEDVSMSENALVISAVTSENRIQVYEQLPDLIRHRAILFQTTKVFTTSLSGDGSILASLACVIPDGLESICESIMLKVYEWNGSAYVIRATQSIDVRVEAAEDISWDSEKKGFGLELSHDGLLLSAWILNCGKGIAHIAVYEWSDSWKQREFPFINATTCEDQLCDGDNDCTDNPSKYGAAALSPDGSILTFRTGGGNVASVVEWNGEAWEALGDPLPTTSFGGLAMAADGLVVAATKSAENSNGEVGVYSFSRPRCPEGMSLLRISLTLDDFPGETSWTLTDHATSVRILEGGGYSRDLQRATVVDETCVVDSSCLVYTLFDAGRNGLQPPGRYALFLNGEDVGNGSVAGTYTSLVIGDCDICLEPVVSQECTLCNCENPFKGGIPTNLAFLGPLSKLHLKESDQIAWGSIPTEIALLTSLTSLDLSRVQMTGNLPSEIAALTALTSLVMDDDSDLTGIIPTELGLLTALRVLELDENRFSGQIPTELGLLSNLEILELDQYTLTGPVPSEIGLLTALKILDLEHNQLTGSIPQTLADNLVFLEEFAMNDTSLTGTIPRQFCSVIIFSCSATLCGCDCACPNENV